MMAYFKTKFTSEDDSNFNVDLESESDAYEAGKRSGGGSVYSVNGKTGNVVLSAEDVGACPKDEVPKKISELVDDTTKDDYINWAENSYNASMANIAKNAQCDGMDNVIHEVYATKDSVPTKLSQLVDDTTELKPIQYANESNYAKLADKASSAECDKHGNDIYETYASVRYVNDNLGDVNAALEEIISLQDQLIGGVSE